MEITPVIITAVSTLGGVLITAIASLIAAYINKKSEERRHLQGLVMSTAITAWQEAATHTAVMPPVMHHVIYTAMMARLMNESHITSEIASRYATEASRVLDVLVENTQYTSSRSGKP